ncbi:hypothetical protein OEA41_002495 [Lepraria neglecta]|uniref:F-box domain-containing protein n=1 Tax=Lepraria neglecta TaxID=209136 RepID=A0AAE0DPZ8_9LECA|nr:hypothetical protein OEA41_002495 [Lepraria neglecta]
MPTYLLSLPNELLYPVIQLVPFEDIEAFSLSCLTIHRNAQSKLHEHRDRKSKLMTIAVGGLETSWRMGVHALLTLSEMLAYPEKTLHPKTLIVGAIYPDPVALWMISDIDDGNETPATGTICAIVNEVKDELKSKAFDIHQWSFPTIPALGPRRGSIQSSPAMNTLPWLYSKAVNGAPNIDALSV